MRSGIRSVGFLSLSLSLAVVSGCGLTPLIPVTVPLGGTQAEISVSAGDPTAKSGTLSFTTPDAIDIGRGTLELDASVISLQSNGGGGAKVNTLAQQVQEACLAACNAAGAGSSTCDAVCTAGQLQITVWVAAPADQATVCDGGTRDTYGPFLVTLDETGAGVSVSPPSVTLASLTVGLLNQGSLSTCIEVIAPEDGTVLIDQLILNVGL